MNRVWICASVVRDCSKLKLGDERGAAPTVPKRVYLGSQARNLPLQCSSAIIWSMPS